MAEQRLVDGLVQMGMGEAQAHAALADDSDGELCRAVETILSQHAAAPNGAPPSSELFEQLASVWADAEAPRSRARQTPSQAGCPEFLIGQERLIPRKNIAALMTKALPKGTKIAFESKLLMQELVSEFIAFVTAEANDFTIADHRKSVSVEDHLKAFEGLDLDCFLPAFETASTALPGGRPHPTNSPLPLKRGVKRTPSDDSDATTIDNDNESLDGAKPIDSSVADSSLSESSREPPKPASVDSWIPRCLADKDEKSTRDVRSKRKAPNDIPSGARCARTAGADRADPLAPSWWSEAARLGQPHAYACS